MRAINAVMLEFWGLNLGSTTGCEALVDLFNYTGTLFLIVK